MRTIDISDLKNYTDKILDSLENEKDDIVLTKDGEPVAILKKCSPSENTALSHDAFNELIKSDKNIATQYAAMMKVWGDPHCDAYDEAFMDD